MRLYYTTKERPYDYGLFAMGDIFATPNGPIGNGIVEHTIDCPASCSWLTLSQPVTVLRSIVHMHATAVSAKIEIIRNGKVRREMRADFFDFDQQGTHMIHEEPYIVEPGDAFRLSCTYISENDVKFGNDAKDEMCQFYLGYYPKQKLLGIVPWVCGVDGDPLFLFNCQATHKGPKTYGSVAEIDRVFGSASDECPDPTMTTQEPPSVSFFGCPEVDESPTLLGIQYWMHNDAPFFSNTCGETRVRGLFVWLMQIFGYECGRCPGFLPNQFDN